MLLHHHTDHHHEYSLPGPKTLQNTSTHYAIQLFATRFGVHKGHVTRLSTADCICISGLGASPQTPTATGALPLDSAGGLLSPKPPVPPYLQTLATPLADSTRFTVFSYLLISSGWTWKWRHWSLAPYSSKTSHATGTDIITEGVTLLSMSSVHNKLIWRYRTVAVNSLQSCDSW